MLLVEVMVPSIGTRYDFELEETAPIEMLIQEMVAVICQKERCKFIDEGKALNLFSKTHEQCLNPALTLRESGIISGQQLILL